MTADQVDAGVTNQLLSTDLSVVQPQAQPELSYLGRPATRCPLPPVRAMDLNVSLIKPISGLTDSMTQDSVTGPDTLPDLTQTPQSAPEPQQIKPRGDSAAEDNGTDCNSDMHVLILLTQNPVAQAHRLREPPGRDRLETVQSVSDRRPPVPTGGLVSDCSDGTLEDNLGSWDQEQSDSPNELWLDACQHLTGEEDEGSILNKWGRSPEVGGAWPPDSTRESGFPPGVDAVIGQSAGDLRRSVPAVERWSSEDSWSSALSDWPVAVTLLPEDFSAAFTQTETQTNTQSRLQRPMAIQDQAVEPRPSPETPLLAGQSCFSSSPTAPGELCVLAPLQDRDREESQTEDRDTPSEQGDKQPGETQATQDDSSACPTDIHSSLGSLCGTLASKHYSLDMSEMDTAHDIRHEEDAILLSITEDSDSQYNFLESDFTFVKLDKRKPCRDAVGKVTEVDSVSQLGSLTQDGGDRSYGLALNLSHYPAAGEAKAPKVERAHVCGADPEQSAGLRLFSHSQRNVHVPGDTPGQGSNPDTHVSSSTPPPEVESQGEQWGSPQFIMPLAPFSVAPPHIFRSNSTLEREDCAKSSLSGSKGHICSCIQPAVLWPTFGGITDQPPSPHEEKLLIDPEESTGSSDDRLSDQQGGQLTFGSGRGLNKDSLSSSSSSGEDTKFSSSDRKTNVVSRKVSELSRELSNLAILTGDSLMVCEKDRIAYVTLDLQDPLTSGTSLLKPAQSDNKHGAVGQRKGSKMPHKASKNTSEVKTHSKKDKSASHHLAPPPAPQQASQQQENLPQGAHIRCDPHLRGREDEKDSMVTVIETVVITEKVPKAHGKKKKKHGQNGAAKSEAVPLVEVENGAKQKTAKGKIDISEAKPGVKTGKSKEKPTAAACKKDGGHPDSAQTQPQQPAAKAVAETASSQAAPVGEPLYSVAPKERQASSPAGQLADDIVKRRRLSEAKFGKHAVEPKAQRGEGSVQGKREDPKTAGESARKKAYSEVVKQKTHTAKEVPRVVQAIQPSPVTESPQSLCLWCQFSAVFCDHTITWSKEGVVQAQEKRSAGDESRVSFTISKASSKDLGKYQCCLSSPHGPISLDYLLTYEVLSEIVIPPPQTNIPAGPAEVLGEEEDVKCSRLMFREDFLCEQYFGEDQPACIMTEKVHFGEGMHRRAFRTKLQAGMVPVFTPGHPCVLKVHNSISYGTKSNEELVQKNYNLAVEECYVQNTAREYIKAYTTVAQSNESFGDVPEIIPIYLVHRPSNDIPYATMEEELMGDFVKYSVRDGKEINLMRQDSEAGQKCCAFQHWVYHKTEGSLLVTDMQGVGMRLTDVGIATCQKGYRGFRGNCATSFIEQFKALHLCNKYCELLGLKSLQPKPRKAVSAPKPKAQPGPKKKTFGPTVKGKS